MYYIVASEKKLTIEAMSKYGEVKKLSLEEIFGYRSSVNFIERAPFTGLFFYCYNFSVM